MTILKKIKQNALNNPDREAFVLETSSSKDVLTWKELDEYSDYLAGYLNKNLKTKTPIVVYGHKDPFLIVCFLACVKSGRAYCPVDINVPLDRIKSIVEEVNPEIILSTWDLDIDRNILSIDKIKEIISLKESKITEKNYVKKDDVFYIIFTSGSTGKPKGVQITRDCLDNFLKWAKKLGGKYENNKRYTFINQAPFSFDLSVMDLYLTLYTGGTLWSLPKCVQGDMELLCKSLKDSDANVWVSTPSFADVCLSEPNYSAKILPNLKKFLFCGEVLTNKTVERLQERFPDAKIINTYGPTESTVAITDILVSKTINKKIMPLPVGKPKKGTWIEIQDNKGNILPEGEKGEIVIIGDSVSIGYFNNDELSKKVFGKKTIENKEYRYYKTGDEGYLKNNYLYYSGRIDLQIKLHGYRIEIEDVENNFIKATNVKQVAVMPKIKDGKVVSLIAFVVNKENIEDEFQEALKLKEKLKKYVPDYMIPRKIKFVSSLPRTNNGKIDRKSLGELL